MSTEPSASDDWSDSYYPESEPVKVITLQEAKNQYGDSWKEKLLLKVAVSGDFDEVDETWKLVDKELTVQDTPLLAKLLTEPDIANEYYSKIKDCSIRKVMDFSKDSPFVENDEVVDNLKKAMLLIKDYIKSKDLELEELVEYDVVDLFNITKTLMLYSPKNVSFVTDMMNKDRTLFSKNFYDQAMEMEIKINQGRYDDVRKTEYHKKLFVRPQHNHDYFQGLYYGEIPFRDPSAINLEDDILKSEEPLPDAKEAVAIATKTFMKDISFMKEIARIRAGEDGVGKYTVSFRALITKNPADPDGVPLMIARPNLEFERRRYSNGDGNEMFHADIWDGWVIEAQRNPGSDRAKLVKLILSNGGYESLDHLYMSLIRDPNGDTTLELESGWSLFFNEKDASMPLVDQMANYGVSSLETADMEEDKIMVEKLILADEMQGVIVSGSEKLSRVLSSRSVNRFRRLAKKFLSDPNANKETAAYRTFQEYRDLIGKL